MIKTFNFLFVTMLGLGKVKFIPGTFGSLATVIILYICFQILNLNSNVILLGILIIFIYSFIAVTNHTKNSENKDPGEIVIDEFIGQSIHIFLDEVSHVTVKEHNEAIRFNGVCHILVR